LKEAEAEPVSPTQIDTKEPIVSDQTDRLTGGGLLDCIGELNEEAEKEQKKSKKISELKSK